MKKSKTLLSLLVFTLIFTSHVYAKDNTEINTYEIINANQKIYKDEVKGIYDIREFQEKSERNEREVARKELLQLLGEDTKNLEQMIDRYLKDGEISIITTKDSNGNIINTVEEVTPKELSVRSVQWWILESQSWSEIHPPSCINTENHKTWGYWLLENNYCSEVPYTVKTKQEKKVSVTLSCEGSLTPFDEVGITAGAVGKYEAITSYEVGYNVPAWVILGKIPYVQWGHKDYEGVRYYNYYNYWNREETKHTMKKLTYSKDYKIAASNNSWSNKNSSENPNATAPSPPNYQGY